MIEREQHAYNEIFYNSSSSCFTVHSMLWYYNNNQLLAEYCIVEYTVPCGNLTRTACISEWMRIACVYGNFLELILINFHCGKYAVILKQWSIHVQHCLEEQVMNAGRLMRKERMNDRVLELMKEWMNERMNLERMRKTKYYLNLPHQAPLCKVCSDITTVIRCVLNTALWRI